LLALNAVDRADGWLYIARWSLPEFFDRHRKPVALLR